VTKSTLRAFFTALLIVLVAPLTAAAQTSYWVQIEAHATLRTAEDFATRYEGRIGNIAGFRIAGGWYGLAIGPFASEADAEARRTQLLAARKIRDDAYVTDDTIYGQQFWPVGGQATTQAPLTVNTAEVATEPAAPAAEPTVDPTVAPEAGDTADVTETVVATTPEPEPAPEPVETQQDAQRAEAQLSRDDRAAIQTALQWFGYYRFGIDAQFGPGTRAAIRAWQDDNGYEPWGVLSTAQRGELLRDYDDAVARYSFTPFRDDEAGIEMTLPLGLVAFDRHEAPFAHFEAVNDSGMRVLLISQEGSQATFFGLYEIMQTLRVIPVEGERDRGRDRFIITGQNDTQRAHVEARLQNGVIKGWALLWEPSADADAQIVIDTMRDSFRPIAGVLPSNLGATASAVARRDLVAGLEVRRPERSRSGFFVDAVGTVVTTAEAVRMCDRVTIDEAYQASVRVIDEATGVAVLTPQDPLVPLAFAQFASQPERTGADIRVSGFSYQDTLTRPILSFGQLADLQGLNGEPELARLTMDAEEGDQGGPVFNSNGAVIGMLLPRPETPGRLLPDDVNFAVNAQSIMNTMRGAGITPTPSSASLSMSAEILTRVSADLTVLVSCWN
jgi:S1-C subfamily serine protease/peptidoglycan hydrolase-like protein with peptidoglycan-binding domain